MSTKRLARTVIEGGRANWNKWDRRRSHRRERADLREWLHQIRVDPALAETSVPRPRYKVYKHFFDKLGPAERWLRKRVGQPWRSVEGEVLRTFDTRSLAGQHIVFDHLLPSLWSPWEGWRVNHGGWFHVDDGGTLRFSASPPPSHPYFRILWTRARPLMSDRALAFVGERRVGSRGARLYWLIPTRDDDAGEPPRRQGNELSPSERDAWEALSPPERRAITICLS